VTFYIYDKDKRRHMGECEHAEKGRGKVLTHGQPNKFRVEFRELK
jgi:hypothetical protein